MALLWQLTLRQQRAHVCHVQATSHSVYYVVFRINRPFNKQVQGMLVLKVQSFVFWVPPPLARPALGVSSSPAMQRLQHDHAWHVLALTVHSTAANQLVKLRQLATNWNLGLLLSNYLYILYTVYT